MEEKKQEDVKKPETSKAEKTKTIIGIVLCVIFGFVLIVNMTIIIKGIVNPNKMPSVLGITPAVVRTESMSGSREGHLEKGDLIFIKKVDMKDLEVGDVITFKDSQTTYRTHRIVEIKEDGSIATAGDALGDSPGTRDNIKITQETLAGRVTGRIPLIGYIALAFEDPIVLAGVILLFVGGFIVYDILRRRKEEKAAETSKTSELEAELERLRALAAANNLSVEATATPEALASENVPEEVKETTEAPVETSVE